MLEQILVNSLFLILFIYLNKKIRNGFHILQLEHYQLKSYNKWIKNHFGKVFPIKEIIIFLIVVISSFINLKIATILVILLTIILYITFPKQKEKKPLVITNRIKRMYITNTALFLLIVILANIFNLRVGILIAVIYTFLTYYLVEIINIVNKPIEQSIQNKFYNSAKRKLKQNEDLKVIGITGSYGKTSTKYIVSTILEQKYNVLMTPESYNTTMGVVRTINEHMKPEHQIFVCEMGARHIGDIKEICDLVEPNYGILTSIGPQHLDTFKTLDNVKKTKMELVDAIQEDGIAFVNQEDENIQTIEIKNKNIKYGLTNKNCDYYADNIQITEKGSSFDVHTKDGIISVKTKLLGTNNIINIVAAVSVAKELGLNDEQIKLGIRMLKPVPHRLELIQGGNGSIIIDDAFNANVKGSASALEVLKSFKERKKILVTPGMVELGDKQYEYNKNFGKQAAKSADYVILVGEKQSVPIKDGLQEENYPQEQIYIAKNLEEAIKEMNKVITKDSVVLLENDLPDNYL